MGKKAVPWLLTFGKMIQKYVVEENNFPQKKVDEARAMIFDLVENVGVDSLAIAYNGGKDSIVLQHLVRTTVGMDTQIKLLLWHVADEFPEVIECINKYRL